MSIPLPPLPRPTCYDSHMEPVLYDADELRARDQEIVRAVLKAATKACRFYSPWHNYFTASEAEAAIRALEFHHAE